MHGHFKERYCRISVHLLRIKKKRGYTKQIYVDVHFALHAGSYTSNARYLYRYWSTYLAYDTMDAYFMTFVFFALLRSANMSDAQKGHLCVMGESS